jgi:MFS family permease
LIGPAVIPALRREFASLPRVYWIIWLGTLVNKMGGLVVPFLTIYLTREHYSAAEAGFVLGMYGAGSLLAALAGGMLSDRVGRRFTMMLSMFGGAAGMLALGFARSLPTIALSAFFMGSLAEMYRPAVSAMVADVVPPKDRARAYAHLYWVINLGFALAVSIGGYATRLGYLTLFIVDACTMAGYGFIVFFLVPESRPALKPGRSRPSSSLVPVLRDRVFMAIVFLSFGVALAMWQNGSTLPIDMQRNGISEETYGLLFAINGVLIVFLQPWINARLRHRPRTAVLALSVLVFGVGIGMYGFVDAWPGYALAITVWSIGEIAHLPTLQTVVADLAPADQRGRYQGLYNVAWAAASFAGPFAGGAALGALGSRGLWLSFFAVLAGIAVGHVWLGRRRHERETAPRASTGEIG